MQIKSSSDIQKLQDNLTKLYEWSKLNNMVFNGDKFEHLRYGYEIYSENYKTPGGEEILVSEDVSDLGITMSSTGNFERHISDICVKGSQMTGWILRTFKIRDPHPMMVLFKALVLPILEYCCQIWSPNKLFQIRSIESVQRHFTKKLTGTSGMTYKERLKFLRIYSLERRRDRYAVIYIWKIIQGLVPNLLGKDKIESHNNLRLGRFCNIPSINRKSPMYVQSLRENSLCIRGAKVFNTVPRYLRDFDGNLETFKENLDKFLSNLDDVPIDPNEPQSVSSNSIAERISRSHQRLD